MTHDIAVTTLDDHASLGEAAARVAEMAILRALDATGHARVMLAAAPSQLPVLTALASSDLDFSKVSFVHMDDYVGLEADAPQGFGNWLETHFLGAVSNHGRFDRINTTIEPAAAAEAYHDVLGPDPFALTLCGLGTNAHIAFNDPGSSFTDPRRARYVHLATASRQQQVDEGHFGALDEVPEHAITVTIPRLLAADTIVCSVLGQAKRQAVIDTLTHAPTEDIPGTALKLHPDVHLFVDREAHPDA